MKPLILTGHGLNCAREMALGFHLVGAPALVVHLNDLPQIKLLDYDILVLPGGFSFGDHLGSGRALSQRLLRAPLGQAIRQFVDSGRLVWGVCNGFQTLVQMGLLPQGCTLAPNQSGRFECRWVRLAVNPHSPCLFTRGLTHLELPVRHGEGRLLGSPPSECVPLRYADASGAPTQQYPDNPNGSPLGAAALCDPSGRIFGLMPHPEAFLRWTQHPTWTKTRDLCQRQGLPLPTDGQGLSLFRAAVSSRIATTL
ncbi:phosphoribosylformylglycinamidine synthase subunit PurQ [bacterium]|nr:phosphoribosylformylglycinamidine synthase subunit PurQ [bacterium]